MPTRAECALAQAVHPVHAPDEAARAGRGLRFLAYEAFCRDHWTAYRAFGAAAAGSARLGADIARSALRDLAAQWDATLQAAAPAALAWGLLSAKCDPHHRPSVRRLRSVLAPREVDALLLHYRVGLSAPESARTMGLDGPGFELLRTRALRGITRSKCW
ncbi:hypothetical protein [Streptomyces sp. NPDC057682]|uniref:hypothetical protein n=1 Tax=Streptomyces sp. NPDC057682 TaxID=3346210 RepID=UPI0036A29946